MLRVTAFDHLVVRVHDVDRALDFCCGRLGLEPVRVAEWRAGTAPFPSVRVSAETIIDLVRRDGTSTLDHLCLVVEPLDRQAVVGSGRFDVVDGPGPRFGARGDGESLYVHDPDGNTVELRCYPQDRLSDEEETAVEDLV
ncbi:VOC family protein [Micromonospora echinospora]